MNAQKILAAIQAPFLKKDLPSFRTGDTVRVHVKVVEGESERVQPFEGVVLYRRGSGISQTYCVRKISFGVGIERTFPLHSPRIAKIEVIKSGKARRARLYFLRKLSGKAARLTEKEVGPIENKRISAETSKSLPSPKKDNPEPELSHSH